MNQIEKGKYLKEQCDLVEGSVVMRLDTVIKGENVSLLQIRLKQANGDEFIIKSVNNELEVIQVMWGVV